MEGGNLRATIVVILILATFSSIGCSKEEKPSLYQVVDSGAWVSSAGGEQTSWLDNERILFVSNKDFTPEMGGKALTIWNPSLGRLKSSHAATSLICTEEEEVFFVLKNKETGVKKFYYGSLENPEEYPQPSPDMRLDDFIDCDWVPSFSRASVPYRIKLKDENYLEILKDQTVSFQSKIQPGEAQYYQQLDLPPTPLPIFADLAGDYSIKFNRRLNAYFISPSHYYPDDPYYKAMWWLQRDGAIKKEPFPSNIPWPSSGGLTFYPLRAGYLALYQGGPSSMTDAGLRGLYFIQGEVVEPVLLGAIHAVSVSPDGCSAAFVHAKNTEEYFSTEKPYRTAKTISFCDERKK